MVNNGVSADETAAPTGPTDNATVATGHSDTLLPPLHQHQRHPVPILQMSQLLKHLKLTLKNEGVTTETPKVTDGSMVQV
ncbi:MAG: hypothetical protein ACLRWM_07790 [Streptococcus sp.]